VFGPTLSWRRRVRLAAYLAFRRGYPPRAEGGVS
jgi:hypothetical protein